MNVELLGLLCTKEHIIEYVELRLHGDVVVDLEHRKQAQAHVIVLDETKTFVIAREIGVGFLEVEVVHPHDAHTVIAVCGKIQRMGGLSNEKSARQRSRGKRNS